MPVVVVLTPYLNQRHLPEGFRPGPVWFAIRVLVGLHYGFFADFCLYDLLFRGGHAVGAEQRFYLGIRVAVGAGTDVPPDASGVVDDRAVPS